MYKFETNIRVRYAETDQMGYVYYGHYAVYYEVARVESLRHLGFSYKSMEDQGIIMPVAENKSRYLRPAKYDDLLTIKLEIRELPGRIMKFHYEIFNELGKLLNVGETVLAFVEKETGRSRHAPEAILSILKPYFNRAT